MFADEPGKAGRAHDARLAGWCVVMVVVAVDRLIGGVAGHSRRASHS